MSLVSGRRRGGSPRDQPCRLAHDLCLVGETHDRQCLIDREPGDAIVLRIVPARIAAGRHHQVVVYRLTNAGVAQHEPVSDAIDWLDDPNVQASSSFRPETSRARRAATVRPLVTVLLTARCRSA